MKVKTLFAILLLLVAGLQTLDAQGFRVYKSGDTSLSYVGSDGNYWSRSLDTPYYNGAYDLGFSFGEVYFVSYCRCYGRSVRPVRVP